MWKHKAFWVRKLLFWCYNNLICNIGIHYFEGEEKSKALRWFLKAAESDDQTSLLSLGMMYFGGQGVDCDYFKAYEYFIRAAALGNAEATYYVGKC